MAQITHDSPHGDYIAHSYNIMPDGRHIDILGPQKQVDIFSSDAVRQFTPDQLIQFVEQETFQGKNAISRSEIAQKLADANQVIDKYILPHILGKV